MTTVEGLFGAGDAVGGTPSCFLLRFPSPKGRLAAKAACKYIDDGKAEGISVSSSRSNGRKEEIYQAAGDAYKIYRNEITAGYREPELHPSAQALDRLQKLMDEYAGGVTVNYMTNEKLLSIGLKKLKLMEEDLEKVAAENIHELLRAWESQASSPDLRGGGSAHACSARKPAGRATTTAATFHEARRRELARADGLADAIRRPASTPWKRRPAITSSAKDEEARPPDTPKRPACASP